MGTRKDESWSWACPARDYHYELKVAAAYRFHEDSIGYGDRDIFLSLRENKTSGPTNRAKRLSLSLGDRVGLRTYLWRQTQS